MLEIMLQLMFIILILKDIKGTKNFLLHWQTDAVYCKRYLKKQTNSPYEIIRFLKRNKR